MINRDDYTDEAWQEFIARCKLMSMGHEWQMHEWQLGDCFYVPSTDIISVVANNNAFNWNIETIWLPSLGQLVRMPTWTGGGLFGHHTKWEISSNMGGLEALGSNPELTVIRSNQRCEALCEPCDEQYTVDIKDMTKSLGPTEDRNQICAGIHLPDLHAHRMIEDPTWANIAKEIERLKLEHMQLHLCIECWRKTQ